MASKAITLCLAMVLMTMFWAGAMAQSGCTNVIIGMAPCLNFITGNSSSPSSSCCSQLSSVVQSQPQCLCSVLNGGGAALGLAINQTLALALPGACSVQTPSVSQCNAVNGPATSPTTSPVDIPANSPSNVVPGTTAESPSDVGPETPSTPANNIPAGSGSKTVPTAGSGDASDGIVTKVPLHLSLFLLFIVSCVSSFNSF